MFTFLLGLVAVLSVVAACYWVCLVAVPWFVSQIKKILSESSVSDVTNIDSK